MVYWGFDVYFNSSAAADTEQWVSNDDNGESLHLFMAPTHYVKEHKKPSKWLQKVIKSRGLK